MADEAGNSTSIPGEEAPIGEDIDRTLSVKNVPARESGRDFGTPYHQRPLSCDFISEPYARGHSVLDKAGFELTVQFIARLSS